jgi:hypothetical protein
VYPVPFKNVSHQSAVSTVCREEGREIRRKEGRKEGKKEGRKRKYFQLATQYQNLPPYFSIPILTLVVADFFSVIVLVHPSVF